MSCYCVNLPLLIIPAQTSVELSTGFPIRILLVRPAGQIGLRHRVTVFDHRRLLIVMLFTVVSWLGSLAIPVCCSTIRLPASSDTEQIVLGNW